MAFNKPMKNANIYRCYTCDFICSKQSNYNSHILTRKHKILTNTYEILPKNATMHICSCGKKYKHRQSLYNHKSQCLQIHNPTQDTPINIPDLEIDNNYTTKILHNDDKLQTNLILELVKQNQELKNIIIQQSNQMMEQNKTIIEVAKNSNINNNNTINNTNSNNKTFNLQFFLNETCKNAMNMSDFIETIDVQMNELENIGHNGYVAGMTDIILSRIKDLDVSKRPVHCTDLKRETMYIKDHNEWNKDTAEKSYLRKAISVVSKKNCGKTMEWRERNPECLEIGSPKYDFCFKMMRNVLGDFEDVQIKMDNKIIKSLAKEVVVDR
jgi:hypothetical protein